MPLLLANFIYSRDCKLNLRKNIDTTSIYKLAGNFSIPSEGKREENKKSAVPSLKKSGGNCAFCC